MVLSVDKCGLKTHFFIAFLIRVAFTVFGVYHDYLSDLSMADSTDSKISPKYTDIDYQVFTDAARHVYLGESPYERDTYRYTPILAIIMQPNIFFNNSFGKCMFILFDLLCGCLIAQINRMNKSTSAANTYSILFWFYNPITVAISSRGNAESVMAFLVLVFLFFLKRGNYLMAGLFYAISIHFKIYPVIYGLAVLFYITKFSSYNILRLIFDKKVLTFGVTFAATLAAITAFFYVKYVF